MGAQGLGVFVDDFDRVAALADATCPRCRRVGLVQPTAAQQEQVKPGDVHHAAVTICPSIAALCPACGLLGEWPAMDSDAAEGPVDGLGVVLRETLPIA